MRYVALFSSMAVLTVAVLGCQSMAAAPAPSRDVYKVREAGQAIAVDGRLDEPAWQRAGTINRFYVFSPKNPPAVSPTEVRLLWDREYLYLAYQCEDVDIWSFSDKQDDSLWNGDVGEFFIKPDRDNKRYYEFVIAPNGTLYDGRYPSRGAGGANRFKVWNSDAMIAATVNGTDGDFTDDDAGYVIEAAIPWTAFREAGTPSVGTEWTFGAFRYDYSKQFEDPLLLKSFPGPAAHGFHSYEGFGTMRFVTR